MRCKFNLEELDLGDIERDVSIKSQSAIKVSDSDNNIIYVKKEKGTSSMKGSHIDVPVESPRQSKCLRLVVNEVQQGKGKQGTNDKRGPSPEPSALQSASTKILIGLSYDHVAGTLDCHVAIYKTYTEHIVIEIESSLEELRQMVRLVAEIKGHLGCQGEAGGSRHVDWWLHFL
jgi:hypothetical protein